MERITCPKLGFVLCMILLLGEFHVVMCLGAHSSPKCFHHATLVVDTYQSLPSTCRGIR